LVWGAIPFLCETCNFAEEMFATLMQKGLEIGTLQYGDVVLVAAAGNEASSPSSYPASSPHVISVASTNIHDQRSSFSNYGDNIDVAAPGGTGDIREERDILSLSENNGYRFLMGTSMASPQVAGLAALIRSIHPEFTNEQVRDVIKSTTDPVSSFLYIGTGRINAKKALMVNSLETSAQISSPSTSSFVPLEEGHIYAHLKAEQ